MKPDSRKPEPMSIYEAIEVMKILRPYIGELRAAQGDGLLLATTLIRAIRRDNPLQGARLLSLLFHSPIEDIAHTFQDGKGEDFVMALIDGFVANPIPDLVRAGQLIGLNNNGWD